MNPRTPLCLPSISRPRSLSSTPSPLDSRRPTRTVGVLSGALLLLSGFVSAAQPGDLETLLTRLEGTAPVNARLSLTYDQRNDNDTDPPPQPATIRADVRASEGGIRLSVERATLDRAHAESRATDTENRKPVALALSQMSAIVADRYLNAAPHLLALLERAKLRSVSQGKRRGKPATILDFVVEPRLSKQQRKYIRELDATARIWLDGDGYPVAAEERMDLTGRALLVINFESRVRESFEFAHREDRLIVTRHRRRESSSGGGESGSRTTEARLVATGETGRTALRIPKR